MPTATINQRGKTKTNVLNMSTVVSLLLNSGRNPNLIK